MKWKTQKSYRMNSEEGQMMTSPIIINTEQIQAAGASMRVMENTIFFYDEITNESMLDLNRILREVDIKLQNTRNILGDEYTPIIHLHLSTPGGSIYAAFACVDTMRLLKSKIYTYVDGVCASAGTLISTIGHKRFMGEHAHLLIHQLSSETYGT